MSFFEIIMHYASLSLYWQLYKQSLHMHMYNDKGPNCPLGGPLGSCILSVEVSWILTFQIKQPYLGRYLFAVSAISIR